MFRLFGSPYTSGFHQCLTYLRLKRRYPWKLYCSGYLTTILYATFYKSRTMGVQTPAILYRPWGGADNSHNLLGGEPSHESTSTIATTRSPFPSPSPTPAATRHGLGLTVCHVWDLEEVVERYENREKRVYERWQALYREEMKRKVHVTEPSSSSNVGEGEESREEKGRRGSIANHANTCHQQVVTQKKRSEKEEESVESVFLDSPRPFSSHATTNSLPKTSSSSSSSLSSSDSSSFPRTQIPFDQLFPDLPSSFSPLPPHFSPLRLHPDTHPRLYQLQWAISLYTYWWLGKTSLLYRFVISEGREVIAGLLYYFLMIPAGGRAMTHLVAPFAKKAIGGPLASTGVCEATSPYMMAHFQLLVRHLEAHFALQAEEDAARAEEVALEQVHLNEVENTQRMEAIRRHCQPVSSSQEIRKGGTPPAPGGGSSNSRSLDGNGNEDCSGSIQLQPRFLLGTPHPLLCDVLLGAVFSSVFLMDDPPASSLLGGDDFHPQCPYLVNYIRRVTGWNGDWLPEEGPGQNGFATQKKEEGRLKGKIEGEREPGSDSYSAFASFGAAAAARSSSSFPDVIPESLLGVLELIEEVLPFLLSQVAALRAFMTEGKGLLKLTSYKVDGGLWEGCQARILPALTPMESLMMVDDCLLTVRSRAFDLELALKAGQALCECKQNEQQQQHENQQTRNGKGREELEEENGERPDACLSPSSSIGMTTTATTATTTTAHRVFTNDATEDLLQPPAHENRQQHQQNHEKIEKKVEDGHQPPFSASLLQKDEMNDKLVKQELEKNGRAGVLGEKSEGGDGGAPFFDEKREERVMDAEDADFYRAFTNSIRHRDRVLQRRASASAMVAAATAKARARAAPASVYEPYRDHTHTTTTTAVITSSSSPSLLLPSVQKRLHNVFQRVTGTIRQMHCPNYTIATVPYKRRYVSAIIPEHEACKARERIHQEDKEAEEYALREMWEASHRNGKG